MIAAVDSRIPASARHALEAHGFEVILMPPHPALPQGVASHPDLLFFISEETVYTTRSYFEIAETELKKIAFSSYRDLQICGTEIGETYPYDILLDAAPIGNRLLCHPKHTAIELLTCYGENVIPVRQGYAKCACVPITDHALITADRSIQKAAEREGIEVLRIGEGSISLEGYSTGFIGGASSYCPDGTVSEIYFCGRLSSHPDGQAIAAFCSRHGKTAISLGEFPLTDVGTIFLL
ncbi:MAG: hypothetical protein IKC59_02245 [Clostridia bacterium]|nr:hypothetical protein [Clostridia bacterium]